MHAWPLRIEGGSVAGKLSIPSRSGAGIPARAGTPFDKLRAGSRDSRQDAGATNRQRDMIDETRPS